MTAPSQQDGGLRGAAFFDLDKTLIEGSSAMDFGRAAYRAGWLTRRDIAKAALENLRFRLRGSTDAGTAELRERILGQIAGVAQRDMVRLGPNVLATLLPRLYPEVLQAAYEHQDAGRPAYIVTAASQDIAELLAHVLVLDGGIGARYEVVDGHYTGRPDGPFTYRDGKVEAMREVAERDGLDLAASYAYSDSESDLPMLRAVGHPVAVNPDDELRRIARAEGWQIMRFDKLRRRLRLAAGLATLLAAGAAAGQLTARGEVRRGPWGRVGGR